MRFNFSKQTLYTLLVGMCIGVVVILAILVLAGGRVPWLKAAGVGTGAPDVNARYLDGYGTAVTATSANAIYVSGADGYLPDNSVDSGAIVDGTIVDADISDSAAISRSKIGAGSWNVSSTFINRYSATLGAWCNGCCAAGEGIVILGATLSTNTGVLGPCSAGQTRYCYKNITLGTISSQCFNFGGDANYGCAWSGFCLGSN